MKLLRVNSFFTFPMFVNCSQTNSVLQEVSFDNPRSEPRFRPKRYLVQFVVKGQEKLRVSQKYWRKLKGDIIDLKLFPNHESQHLPQRPLGSLSVLLEVEAGI